MTFKCGANWSQLALGFAILWWSGFRLVLDAGPFWIEIDCCGRRET